MLVDLISNYIVKYGNAANCILTLPVLHTNLGNQKSVAYRRETLETDTEGDLF